MYEDICVLCVLLSYLPPQCRISFASHTKLVHPPPPTQEINWKDTVSRDLIAPHCPKGNRFSAIEHEM